MNILLPLLLACGNSELQDTSECPKLVEGETYRIPVVLAFNSLSLAHQFLGPRYFAETLVEYNSLGEPFAFGEIAENDALTFSVDPYTPSHPLEPVPGKMVVVLTTNEEELAASGEPDGLVYVSLSNLVDAEHNMSYLMTAIYGELGIAITADSDSDFALTAEQLCSAYYSAQSDYDVVAEPD